jgi:hypothetical protein
MTRARDAAPVSADMGRGCVPAPVGAKVRQAAVLRAASRLRGNVSEAPEHVDWLGIGN